MDYFKEISSVIDLAKDSKYSYSRKWLEELKSYTKICLFGAGEHGISWYHILKGFYIKVDFFLDNNADKWNREVVDGVKCVSPESIAKDGAGTGIVVAVRNCRSIVQQI